MVWDKTRLDGKRRTNNANEVLLDCVESNIKLHHFYVYDRTHILNSWRGIERSMVMSRVSHEVVGNNGVTIFIICDSVRMDDAVARKLAKGWWDGDTLSYRLD